MPKLMRHMGRTLLRCLLGMVVVSLRPNLVTAAVSVAPLVETGPSHHTGDTADDSVIWIHPTDPSQSVVIGDDKNGGMMVWNLNGSELQYIDGSKLLNNVDLRYNFPLSGQYSDGVSHSQVTLVAVGNENGNALTFYKVNPATRRLESAGEFGLSISTPYGGCMYHSPATGKYYYFVNWKSGVWQQVEVFANGSTVTGSVVRTHDAGGQTEGCVADDVSQYYYIGEEAVGVWRYGAEPSAGTSRVQVDKTGSGGHLTADVEGMSLYYKSDGSGYLIVSSQGSSTFQVYQRQPPSAAAPNVFIGEFSVGASGSIDAVGGSDGLDVTNFPLGSNYPQGLLVVHDSANSGGSASNHKLVPWERVAQALSLTSDTSWDPRLVGRSGSLPTPTPTTQSQSPTPTRTPTPSQTPTPGGPTATRTPTPGACSSTLAAQGDANCDCTVSGVDYAIWLTHYQQSTGNGFRDGDFNGDGTVSGVDYAIWLTHYQQTCSGPTPTPPVGGATNTPTPSRTPTPGGPTPTIPVPVGGGIWISPSRLAQLPTSGSAWNNVYSAAQGSAGAPDLSNQDDPTNVKVMAKALVYARIGGSNYLNDVKAALSSIANSGSYNGRALALGRELAAYVISADLINLKSVDSSLDSKFRAKIRELLTTPTSGGPGNLVECHGRRPNNWGTQCGSSRAAVAAYLGDTQELARTAQVFKGYLGDRTSYSGLVYGDLSWQCDSSIPVGINPRGCIKQGHNIDGVLPDDQRRGGSFSWPPSKENYVYSGLQGALSQALILYNAGYDTWNWEDKALLRAFQWLHNEANFPAVGDDTWQPHLINFYYGTSFPAPVPSNAGKNVGWGDWTHSR